jgi:D-3-phosphoglycerate dehydrogenase
MVKPKILYYTALKFSECNLAWMRDHFDVIELESPLEDTPEVLAECTAAFAPLGFSFDRRKIDACKKIRAIGSNTTGHPHIEVAYARQKNIRVITLKDHTSFLETITPTAEHAWGLLLALTRNLVEANRFVLAGGWDRRPFGGNKMLSRMSLGIVGLGRLGSKVAGYGRAFGMKVRYYDPYREESGGIATKVPTLRELATSSDIVSIHAPHEKSTENLIDHEFFLACRPGSYFINTARGELVDHNALLDALKDGTFAGAALDVVPREYEPGFAQTWQQSPLLEYAKNHHNLLLTPHIGGSTRDAWQLTERFTLEKVAEYVESL